MSQLTDVPELAPRVIQLWEVRGKIRSVGALSERTQQWLRAYAAHEETSLGRRPVIETRTQIRKPYRRFATERLKRFHRADYERCRILVPQFTVKHRTAVPDAGDYGEVLDQVPPDASLQELHSMVTLAQAYQEKMRLTPILRELHQDEEQLKAQLESLTMKYLEDEKWDGTAFTFDDGWTYGSRIRKFSTDEAMKILSHEVVVEYSEIVPEQIVTQVMAIGEGGPRRDKGPDANPFEGD